MRGIVRTIDRRCRYAEVLPSFGAPTPFLESEFDDPAVRELVVGDVIAYRVCEIDNTMFAVDVRLVMHTIPDQYR